MIIHGDFFDESGWKRATLFPFKMPFQDSVESYIRKHPGHTVEQCSTALGISYPAVLLACEGLISSGRAKREDEP